MDIGFDVISDLHLLPDDDFNWDGKATSLFCIIAGNLSHDLQTIHKILWHLSKFYQGVFYIGGTLEYSGIENIPSRTRDLIKISKSIQNVTYLHHHVVIVDGVAILGATGWYENTELMEAESDCIYLSNSIRKIQLHQDVKQVVIVSNAVPNKNFYFGEQCVDDLPLSLCLTNDTEKKVSHWIYGQCDKNTDMTVDQITYINNAAYEKTPYWPKRISVNF